VQSAIDIIDRLIDEERHAEALREDSIAPARP